MYRTQYSFYQYCFRLRFIGTVLIREVLLGTRIRLCLSNSGSLLRDGYIITLKDVLLFIPCRNVCNSNDNFNWM